MKINDKVTKKKEYEFLKKLKLRLVYLLKKYSKYLKVVSAFRNFFLSKTECKKPFITLELKFIKNNVKRK
jgi:hypothetical protein